MIGELLGESKGKRIVRRVLSTDPPTVEVTFEDSGQMLGVPTTGLGSYTSVIRPDGSILGQGQGINMTADGKGRRLEGHRHRQIRPRRGRQLSRHVVLPNRFKEARAAQQRLRNL